MGGETGSGHALVAEPKAFKLHFFREDCKDPVDKWISQLDSRGRYDVNIGVGKNSLSEKNLSLGRLETFLRENVFSLNAYIAIRESEAYKAEKMVVV